MAGTTTIVRILRRECRSASASFGSWRGRIADVSSEFSRLIASSLTGMSASSAISHSAPAVAPCRWP